ncbi:hypothetical protein H5410_028787 [Solanum commersonii]|uniref:Uncharacterized protein n=1 Tax=Solanum commersonii TaxID=4109 RepID=A0A9J5Z5X4_SOLCO|nr:hypothetical protein H5410_028787 [Solanum commersonii]
MVYFVWIVTPLVFNNVQYFHLMASPSCCRYYRLYHLLHISLDEGLYLVVKSMDLSFIFCCQYS